MANRILRIAALTAPAVLIAHGAASAAHLQSQAEPVVAVFEMPVSPCHEPATSSEVTVHWVPEPECGSEAEDPPVEEALDTWPGEPANPADSPGDVAPTVGAPEAANSAAVGQAGTAETDSPEASASSPGDKDSASAAQVEAIDREDHLERNSEN